METKKELVVALRTLLRPIIRLLIGLGFNARDFIEIAKTVYVEVATEEHGTRGRKANMSKVAVLTGLTRREVSRLRGVTASDPLELQDPMVPVGRVLSTWYQDERFLDQQNNPRMLAKTGEFASLIDECRGDIPATAVIRELESAGAIEIHNASVHITSRYFMPFVLDSHAIERFGRVIGDVCGTIVRNLMSQDREHAHFEGRAVHECVPENSLNAFRSYLDRRGQEFLEEMDDWLHDHAAEPHGDQCTRVGVGVYMIGNME